MFGLGADEADAVLGEDFRETRILGQKAVSGMHRVRAGDFAGREQGRNVEIAFARGRRADADALIRELYVHRFGVGGGVDRDGRDAELLARAQHTQRNLAAVCNQDLIEHCG